MLSLRQVTLEDPLVQPLLGGLAGEYARVYGGRTDGELASREAADFAPPRGAFLVLVSGGVTVAGGGLAPLAPGVAEVKRMWTHPAHRGRGHARLVLELLEAEAFTLGYRTLRLQTGALQTAALALYRAAGYAPAPAFGRYRDEPLARGFEKRLSAQLPTASRRRRATPLASAA